MFYDLINAAPAVEARAQLKWHLDLRRGAKCVDRRFEPGAASTRPGHHCRETTYSCPGSGACRLDAQTARQDRMLAPSAPAEQITGWSSPSGIRLR
jgi:hypothetical protein